MNIDISTWSNENIYVITRDELIAYKLAGSKLWYIKTIRCSKCGNCCKIHPKNGAYFPLDSNGHCCYLTKDGDKYVCVAGMAKYIACIVGEPTGAEYNKFRCCIEYKEVLD